MERLRQASERPDLGVSFVRRDESTSFLSWSEILARSQEVAGSLIDLGLRRGEFVALIYPTEADFLFAFFGSVLAGGIPAALCPPFSLGRSSEGRSRIASQVRSIDASLVLVSPRVRKLLGESERELRPRLGVQALETLQPPTSSPAEVSLTGDDLAMVQFSSGTTAEPRPIALTHRALIGQLDSLGRLFPPGEPRTAVFWLPLHHDMGLIGGLLGAMVFHTSLYLVAPQDFIVRPSIWLRSISRYGATITAAPSFAYALCTQRIPDAELEGVNLSCWLFGLNGAETISAQVIRDFNDRFARWGLPATTLTPVYGLGECSLAASFSDLAAPFRSERFDTGELAKRGVAVPTRDGRELVSVGRPLPGFSVKICDGHGEPVGPNVVGRLFVRGPSLMREYVNMPAETKEKIVDGWLDTGDLGLTRAGDLFIVGRETDLVIVRGRNHSPTELETPLDGVPGVRKGCAVAVSWMPSHAEHESVVLFVERSSQASAKDDEALAKACAQKVRSATGIAVDRVVALAAQTLPRTSSGKLRRRETLRRHLAGKLTLE